MNLVTTSNVTTMSSLEIAELTGKRHDNVMQDIRNTLEQAGIDALKFEGYYTASNGKQNPCYNLPKLECDLIVTGYSVPYRLAVLKRWQELEAKTSRPMSPAEILVQQAQMLLAQERKLNEVDARVALLESKQNPDNDGFYSIKAFANINGVRLTNALASHLGKRCTKLSKEYGVMTGTVPDSQFGTVHTYHESILEEIFEELLDK